MDKKEVRQRLLDERLRLSEGDVDKKSRLIVKKLIESDIFMLESKICVYLPIKNEVDTKEILNFLLEAGTQVYLPKSYGSDQYKLNRFTSWNDLEAGPYDIKQPKDDDTIGVGQIGVALVPGVAFDTTGRRLGYGRGVYDRLFAKSEAILVGLAYGFQVVDELPHFDHDLRMNTIVTEERILKIT
ncbi:MAG: 5-formyltetrahydrofolate cyclo-ligase [Candidatus Curtissbacteria bacterium]